MLLSARECSRADEFLGTMLRRLGTSVQLGRFLGRLRLETSGLSVDLRSVEAEAPVEMTRLVRRIYAGILRELWSARAGRIL
jgi:hypothetical protein